MCYSREFYNIWLKRHLRKEEIKHFFGKPVKTFFTKETHMLAKYESCLALNSKIFLFNFCLVELLLGIGFHGI